MSEEIRQKFFDMHFSVFGKRITYESFIKCLLIIKSSQTQRTEIEKIYEEIGNIKPSFSELWDEFLIELNNSKQKTENRKSLASLPREELRKLELSQNEPPIANESGLTANESGLTANETVEPDISEENKEPFIKKLREHWDAYDQPDNKLTGFHLGKLKKISQSLDKIRPGLYLIAAETNIGKTAVLLNLLIDALLTNKESNGNKKLHGVFLTFDDSKISVCDRLVAILTYRQIEIDPAIKQETSLKDACQINEILKGWPSLKKESPGKRLSLLGYREKAREELEELLKSRLDIKGISDLPCINSIKEYVTKNLLPTNEYVYCIDALYNIDIESRGVDARQENIERAQFLKRLTDEYNLPIFATAELRKKSMGYQHRDTENPPNFDDIMETGKYAYNANVVIMVYPNSFYELKNDKTPLLILDFQKNKQSSFTGKIEIIFNKTSSTLRLPTEKEKEESDLKKKKQEKERIKEELEKKLANKQLKDQIEKQLKEDSENSKEGKKNATKNTKEKKTAYNGMIKYG